MLTDSSITAPTQFVNTPLETYVYRRFGAGPGLPLLCLPHFTGTFDNWDPAVVDALASEREVVLFESAGIGRSTGTVPSRFRKWRGTLSPSSRRSATLGSISSDFLSEG